MPKTVKGCLIPWPEGDTKEPETNSSVPQQEEQRDAMEGKVIANCNTDVDYKPEGSDTDIEAVDEEEENSDA